MLTFNVSLKWSVENGDSMMQEITRGMASWKQALTSRLGSGAGGRKPLESHVPKRRTDVQNLTCAIRENSFELLQITIPVILL